MTFTSSGYLTRRSKKFEFVGDPAHHRDSGEQIGALAAGYARPVCQRADWRFRVSPRSEDAMFRDVFLGPIQTLRALP
jgi:hypothetical protein